MSGPGHAGAAGVREAHRFDLAPLEGHLSDHVPGLRGLMEVRQFTGGQSNPTFLLPERNGDSVLRKRPPRALLPSAHRVDRKFGVTKTLARTGVPIPAARLVCQDDSILGCHSIAMDFVQRRILEDPATPGTHAFRTRGRLRSFHGHPCGTA